MYSSCSSNNSDSHLCSPDLRRFIIIFFGQGEAVCRPFVVDDEKREGHPKEEGRSGSK
jgi:hypothetical protein